MSERDPNQTPQTLQWRFDPVTGEPLRALLVPQEQRPAAQAPRTTADTLREIKAASCPDCSATGYSDHGEPDSPEGPGQPAVVCGSCMGTGWLNGVHISDQRTAAQAGEVELAFDQGWRMAAEWANRDDLIPDMDSPHYAKERSDRLASLPTQPAAQATPEPRLFIGACITDGRLHATVQRFESNGNVTLVATAEMDAASLHGHDCIAQMKQATPEPVDERVAFEAWLRTKPEARLWNTTDAMLAAYQAGRASLPAPQQATPEPVGEAVAWLVSLPEEPELGEWFSEEDMSEQGYTSKPLFTHPAPGVPEGWTVSAYKAAGLTIQSMAQLKGPDLWKIADAAGNVLNKQGEWEWEPMPSSRDDAFLARCRYATLAEASAALAAAQAKGADK